MGIFLPESWLTGWPHWGKLITERCWRWKETITVMACWRTCEAPVTRMWMEKRARRGGCPYVNSLNVSGGRGGTTRKKDEGRGARAPDALLGWEFLCCEVQEQSATSAGAGE